MDSHNGVCPGSGCSSGVADTAINSSFHSRPCPSSPFGYSLFSINPMNSFLPSPPDLLFLLSFKLYFHPCLAWPSPLEQFFILHDPVQWSSYWETFPDPCRRLNTFSSDFPQCSLRISIIVLSHGSITQLGVCCPRPEASYSSLPPLGYTKGLLWCLQNE